MHFIFYNYANRQQHVNFNRVGFAAFVGEISYKQECKRKKEKEKEKRAIYTKRIIVIFEMNFFVQEIIIHASFFFASFEHENRRPLLA